MGVDTEKEITPPEPSKFYAALVGLRRRSLEADGGKFTGDLVAQFAILDEKGAVQSGTGEDLVIPRDDKAPLSDSFGGPINPDALNLTGPARAALFEAFDALYVLGHEWIDLRAGELAKKHAGIFRR